MLDKLLDRVSDLIGSQAAAFITMLAVATALIVGQAAGFSERWGQIVLIASSLLTLLMVVAIRHRQTKESKAMQIKLDEIVRALANARNEVRSTERASQEKLQELRDRTRAP